MYFEIEKSGLSERKGLVQIRLCFYLDPGDYGYEKHHIQLDGVWQNNPFHNHFIQVEPDRTDAAILAIGDQLLIDVYALWEQEKEPFVKNKAVIFPLVVDEAKRSACNAKIQHLKEINLAKANST